MTNLIIDDDIQACEVEDAFADLFGTDMAHVGDGFSYTGFQLLATLDRDTRREVMLRIYELREGE